METIVGVVGCMLFFRQKTAYGVRSGRVGSERCRRDRNQFGDNFFYILFHNEVGGVAEQEYDSDPRGILSRLYWSPTSPREPADVTDPLRAAGGWIPRLGASKELPDWLTQADLDYDVTYAKLNIAYLEAEHTSSRVELSAEINHLKLSIAELRANLEDE